METKTARFDTRWTAEQKEFFEYASSLGGFRSLSEFVFFAVQERAQTIVEENDRILASVEDRKLFFDTLIDPPEPNEALVKAAKNFASFINS